MSNEFEKYRALLRDFEKYKVLVYDIRRIYTESGSDLLYKPEDYTRTGLNSHDPSRSGFIELVFDYGSLSEMRTPEGSIVVLGSRGAGNDAQAFQVVLEKYGLVEIEPQLSAHECESCASGPVYKITKGLEVLIS